MAGWSSRNKYSLLGAMRAIAQMISYEVPLILSAVAVIMQAGSLSTVTIVEQQAGYSGILPHWFVFTPWGFAGFVLFMIAATAESNRSPFDLPEGESEIIAGYFTEYSGFKFALFFLAEYLGMFADQRPGDHAVPRRLVRAALIPYLDSFVIWFFGKAVRADLRVHLGSRHAAPPAHGSADELRLEIHAADGADQPGHRGLWRFLPHGIVRWLVCGAMVYRSYVLLGRALVTDKSREKRMYRFAE